ncbi:16S rRNA (uracil1498-N3)-methyltransferase [Nocardioides albertanoniae]|uniref:Ribosomal RNA small subunit methyltransferase E n=1 Tax=Nocardioides albertanoniae TaxID=1175486 RepID=A0A543A5G7_9ACTN|nr:16S rRNA (uracil(1498)-N(3))-methyltransferase [Nocardioides albertanoniae]TQL67726.1 16S rRNA (uracil1498-N3)-methyltransferase [Nocardioides albertanoniae]
MTLPVHIVDSLADARVGDEVEVSGDEGHHAVVVRRLRLGEEVMLTDGAGAGITGTISETTKRSMTVRVDDVILADAPPAPAITVVQALPKGDRGELAVEMLTEIGVARIVPWAASRSVAVWKGERAAKSLGKWRATAREAAKQSRRLWHPEVEPLATTDAVVAMIEAADVAVVLHEDGTLPLGAVPVTDEGTILVVVGPEGGLSDDEVAGFEKAGATTVRLGAEVLRTSTAGVAATAALLARTLRWA